MTRPTQSTDGSDESGIATETHRSLSKPMVKPGVRHAIVPSGIYIEAGARNFLINGRALREAIRRLLVGIDGTRSYDDLRSAIPAALATVFDTLIGKLGEYDMLTEGPSGTIDLASYHQGLVRFVQQATPNWERCLIAWKALRITICADRQIAVPLARSLRDAGAGAVRTVMQDAQGSTAAGVDASDHRLDGDMLLWVERDGQADIATLLDDIAERYAIVIPCRLVDGNAVIGPDCRTGPDDWRTAVGQLRFTESGPSEMMLTIVPAILAFEAFASHVAGFARDPNKRSIRSRQVKIVRQDGTITEHGLWPLAATTSEKGASSRRRPDVDRDTDAVAPWFDEAFGPFETCPMAGPAYPLAHETIAVRGGADPMRADTSVDAWGISPDLAYRCALTLAIATMMERRIDLIPAAGISPVVVGSSIASLESEAVALAIAGSDDTVMRNAPVRIVLERWANEDGLMLARLARLYARSIPAVWMRRTGMGGIFIVWARLGEWTVAVAGRDLAVCITEALGDAVSAFQRGALSFRQRRWPWSMWREAGTGDEPALLSPIDDFRAVPSTGEQSGFDVTFELLEDPVIPPGFVAGYAIVKSK